MLMWAVHVLISIDAAKVLLCDQPGCLFFFWPIGLALLGGCLIKSQPHKNSSKISWWAIYHVERCAPCSYAWSIFKGLEEEDSLELFMLVPIISTDIHLYIICMAFSGLMCVYGFVYLFTIFESIAWWAATMRDLFIPSQQDPSAEHPF
jgi:hypothetical protein